MARPAAFSIAAKDLRQRLRDRSAPLIAFVVPMGLAAVLSLVLGGTDDEVTFDYAVLDQDRGRVAQAFTGEVVDQVERAGFAAFGTVESVDEGRRQASDGTVHAVFVIPPGFSEAVAAGQAATIEIIGHVDSPIATQVAGAIARGFAAEVNATRVAVATVVAATGESLDPERAAELAQRAARVLGPIGLEDVSASRRQLDASTYFSVGMAVFFLFFTVQFGVLSLLEERQEGTLNRLMAAPISRRSVLAGKLLTSVLFGLISMAVLVAFTTLLLGADWGNPLGVAVLVVAGVLAATGVTAVVATLARGPEQAGNWAAIVSTILGLLGGAFFPVAQAGGLIGKLTLVTPHAWFIRGMSDLRGGGGVGAVMPATLAILAFAAVFGAIALLRLGRMVRP